MASINTPEAVEFVIKRVRPYAAKASVDLYYASKTLVDEWFAGSLSSVITNKEDEVEDRILESGGHKLTGADVTNVITAAINYVAICEANNKAVLNVLLKASR